MTQLDVDPICVVIGRTRHKMIQIEIQEAAKQGAGFIELRLDFLAKAPDFKRLLDKKPCPLVATVRRPQDGGRWSGTEEARLALIRQAIVAGFDWVDLETDVADSIRRFKDVKRIISYHNMREVPDDLEKIYQHMCSQDGDVVKVAVRAQHPKDNMRVLGLLHNAPRPTIAFCMGDLAMPSRVLGAKLGSPFTYAAFNKERGIAPGLPSFAEMKRLYFYDRINANTKVFGVVGDPVAHSLSPLVHNLAFRHLGINAVYVPFRVPRPEFADSLKAFRNIPVQGYSVTIPHKEEAAELARHKDDSVLRSKSANTLIRSGDDFSAYNTDYQGVIDTLRTYLPTTATNPEALPAKTIQTSLPEPASLHSKVVLVLGAGGIARAVAHALVAEGALVNVTNRTSERAALVAEEVGGRHIEWQGRHSVLCDVVVNCTSVGMHPDVDESPLHPSFLKPGLVVFDTVYTPETTLLVKDARSRGCHVITGVELFVRQAAHQFKLFTQLDAPVELMRKAVKRALSPVVIRDDEDEGGG
ncbi:MAG TPA: type I 3-dehydroquinate dehydratase [Gemmataceae bacterium]|nr:type I 3-dehydroquinate dehydratase [Gemmataceae bacterium]